MWGTVLSDPLPIVALVGRYPANQLMGRMPVPRRLSAFPQPGCPGRGARRITRRFHRLCASGGWVAYALRTRPPLSRPPKGPLPYDLHVLGLPLAFILSQDQTLRCTIAIPKLTSVSWAPLSSAFSGSLSSTLDSLTEPGWISLCWPQALKDRSARRSSLPSASSPLLRAAKIQPFYISTITFFTFFSK